MFDIYCYTNTQNGMQYVGVTADLLKRDEWHKKAARNGSHFPFHEAVAKYGWDAFKLEVLETVSTVDEARDAERSWIESLGSKDHGYNTSIGGDGSPGSVSEETRQRMSEAHKGKTPWNKGKLCPEIAAAKLGKANPKMSAIRQARYWGSRTGAVLSDETRRKISDSCKGRIPWNKGLRALREAA